MSKLSNWTNETFEDIKNDDQIFFENSEGQINSGIAINKIFMGVLTWILDNGQHVSEGWNYIGHKELEGVNNG